MSYFCVSFTTKHNFIIKKKKNRNKSIICTARTRKTHLESTNFSCTILPFISVRFHLQSKKSVRKIHSFNFEFQYRRRRCGQHNTGCRVITIGCQMNGKKSVCAKLQKYYFYANASPFLYTVLHKVYPIMLLTQRKIFC